MMKLKIKSIQPLSSNEKGSTSTLEGGQTQGYILAYRKAGSVSGNHWHEGYSKGKNPERIILVEGSFLLQAKDLDTMETYLHTVTAPCEVLIYPRLLHTLTALQDCIFIECNSLQEHKDDTFYPE